MDQRDNSNDLTLESVQGVGMGAFAQVALIPDAGRVVKLSSDGYHTHRAREKSVYERLGFHPYILKYYGEVNLVSIERTIPGLLLQYHPAGTLEAILSRKQSSDYADITG